ncbi:phage tail tape measure protein [Bradyrhizobium sp. Cp5.3]|uniref:phage tail tape measure protein n=1 Tax=Bradyrhizobium sp. Cp5.3 TaxID=443598 RepID=UPI00040FD5FC|nr:phage tail tape measure protein [Bradyrhizobium sp. Cp5.3]
MISSFSVGATFQILNEASPTLLKILRQVRELRVEIDKAKASMAGLAKMPALGAAIGEADALAASWGRVAKEAAAANGALGRASTAARGAAGFTAGGGGRGGRHQPGFMRGGGGGHIGGPSVPIAGGGHVNFRGGAAAAAGLLGYGAYEAAQMEDIVWQMIYHSGEANTAENRNRFRKVLQDSMAESGYSLHDTGKAALQEIRMFQGTPGHGLDVLPEMMRAAWIEARAKDSSLEESMKSFIGLAHMTKQYDPQAIKKLAPAFAYLSTSNPSSLSSIERSAGYAVPILQSGLEVDPLQTLLLGTALTRAGATSTKSGTWLREMALRAMPGTSLMSKVAFHKHEEALKALGLVDDHDKPTWFTDGKPDLLKMLDIAGGRANSIPLEKRAAYERQLFGAQGAGGFALLSDPAVREQVLALQKEMNSPEFKSRYGSFSQAYTQGSTVQQARTALAEFNNTMMDLGQHVLPPINSALGKLKVILEGIRDVLPGAGDRDKASTAATVGGDALLGAGAGAVYGLAGGPGGAVVGAGVGGVLGVAAGFMESYAKNAAKSQNPQETRDFIKALKESNSSAVAGGPAQVVVKPAPVNLSLNLDGHTLAQAMSSIFASYYSFATGAAAADGLGSLPPGDHQFTGN